MEMDNRPEEVTQMKNPNDRCLCGSARYEHTDPENDDCGAFRADGTQVPTTRKPSPLEDGRLRIVEG